MEGSQILTNFSVHFTNSSIFEDESKKESELELNKNSSKEKSMISTISDSKKYKEMFLNIENVKKKRGKRLSFLFKK